MHIEGCYSFRYSLEFWITASLILDLLLLLLFSILSSKFNTIRNCFLNVFDLSFHYWLSNDFLTDFVCSINILKEGLLTFLKFLELLELLELSSTLNGCSLLGSFFICFLLESILLLLMGFPYIERHNT